LLSLDPELGKLSSPQTLNRYVYCANNPLRFTDPTGEWSFSKWWDKNWKTILVIAVVIAITVFAPELTFAYFVAANAVVQGAANVAQKVVSAAHRGALSGLMSTRGLGSLGLAFGGGLVEEAISGAAGYGFAKYALKPAARYIYSGAAKLGISRLLSNAVSKTGSALGKISPGLAEDFGKLTSAVGRPFNIGAYLEESELVSNEVGKRAGLFNTLYGTNWANTEFCGALLEGTTMKASVAIE